MTACTNGSSCPTGSFSHLTYRSTIRYLRDVGTICTYYFLPSFKLNIFEYALMTKSKSSG